MSGTVAFNQTPTNLRVPLVYFEVNAGYTPSASPSRLLLIGQQMASATALANEPILVTGGEDALFGRGSMLGRMYKVARLIAPFQEIWCAPLADATGATAATATIVCTGFPVANAGTLAIYIGGVRVAVNVTVTMTNANVASAIVAAMASSVTPLEATGVLTTGNTSSVTLTANAKGTVYNALRLETRLLADDSTLADTNLTITSFAGGAGDPDMSLMLANLGSEEFDFIGGPYSDNNSLGEIEAFLTGRWGPIEALYGTYITFAAGTAGALQTLGSARNSPNSTVYGATNFSSSVPALAAACAATHADHLQGAPELSRPLQGLPLTTLLGPKLTSDLLSIQARNTLLYSGISTLTVDKTGVVSIDRAITTYQTNALGSPDGSFLSINTRAQLVFGLRYIKQYVTSIWGRAALVDSNPGGIQNFATAGDLRDSMVHAYSALCDLGVFDDLATFQSLLIVERNATDPNRVDSFLPLDAVNQLNVFAANATSYLQLAANQ